jgi:hypothetical protein
MLYAFLLDSRHEWWDEVVVSPQDDLLPSLAVRRVDYTMLVLRVLLALFTASLVTEIPKGHSETKNLSLVEQKLCLFLPGAMKELITFTFLFLYCSVGTCFCLLG